MTRSLLPDHYQTPGRPEPLSWQAETAASRAGLNPWRAVPVEQPPASPWQTVRDRIREIWLGQP